MNGRAYALRIDRLGRALGIPADYGAARGLARHPEASRLAGVGRDPDGRPVQLSPRAASAWQRMRAAAKKEGIVLLPLSGFRSVSRQRRIIRDKLSAGERLGDILRRVAAPGYSEHHTGRALDIGTPDEPPLVEGFARTAAFRWLRKRAKEFNFDLSYPRHNPHGIVYEPWHWCYRPKGSAQPSPG